MTNSESDWYYTTLLLVKRGDLEEALRLCQEALEDPNNATPGRFSAQRGSPGSTQRRHSLLPKRRFILDPARIDAKANQAVAFFPLQRIEETRRTFYELQPFAKSTQARKCVPLVLPKIWSNLAGCSGPALQRQQPTRLRR